MAVTVNNLQPGEFGFILNATSADVSGCEELKAAPGAGKNIILDTLSISTGAAIDITIGEGETTGAVTTALIGPVTMAEDQTVQFDFRGRGGMILTANTSLTVDASGAGAVCVVCCGRVK